MTPTPPRPQPAQPFSPARLGDTLGLAAVLAVCLAACSPPAPAPAPAADPAPSLAQLLEGAQLVDLTYTYDESTIYWPTSPSQFDLEELAYGQTAGGYFYASNSLCTPEHGGTHLDAPIHFAADRQTADQIPLERLFSPAVVIDVSPRAAADPDYRLTAEDVLAWETEHGAVPEGSIVLLRTGWGKRWPDRKAYLGDDTPGDASNLHFPSFGEASARLLVIERRVAVLGVDTASIDHGPSTDFIVHQIAGQADVPGLENVANLESLPPTGAYVVALPMKIGGGSGGPVRIVAVLPPASA
ncbi:MAG: cyclase family protein [Acidobacteriota bacterium]